MRGYGLFLDGKNAKVCQAVPQELVLCSGEPSVPPPVPKLIPAPYQPPNAANTFALPTPSPCQHHLPANPSTLPTPTSSPLRTPQTLSTPPAPANTSTLSTSLLLPTPLSTP
ncbi:proline-rich receptor-like protein kinase PERK2 [Penaeus monodon]|uniref:proline-rich receptor-like protein kinase PERK2 n=1 Tax=Penaeus monodon TaxID=6687 RepID=UPI0018A77CAA|nr:proline-rich receptor-like protein kinase PERK2 [Penaeus monodon]